MTPDTWYAGWSWRAFWAPVTSEDLSYQWWRKEHIWAHVVGGVFWWALAVNPWVLQDWARPAWVPLLVVFVLQGLWERVQQENWRDTDTPYPWWSAVWDVLFALAGALPCEVVRVAL